LALSAERILKAPPVTPCDASGRPVLPVLNFYRTAELGNDVFVASVDSGSWTFLDRTEHTALRSGDLSGELERRLEASHILLTEQNLDEYVERLGRHYGFLNEGPTLHILVVTPRCNLTCVYCQASSAPSLSGGMTTDVARTAVERAFETPADSLIIEFQGGEPLLNFDAVRAAIERARQLEELTQKRVEFSLISNFTEPATEEKLAFLIDAGVSVCFSLDGPAQIHDANRGMGHPGCHQAVVRNIGVFRRLWEARNTTPVVLRAMMTTTRASLPHARQVVESYIREGINRIAIRPVTRLGRGLAARAVTYEAPEFVSFWKQVVDYVLETRERGVEAREVYLELILKKLFTGESGFMDLRSPCGASFGQVVYHHDGGIYTCDEGRMIGGPNFRIGDISQPLACALRSDRARAVIEASMTEHYACDFCAFRPFCGVCPVLHWAHRGTLVPNILEEDRCVIFGSMIRHVLSLFAASPDARAHFERMLCDAD